VRALFYHLPPTPSPPSSAFTGARSPIPLTRELRGRQGNPQMEIPMLSSYLKIGWHWVHYALNRGYELITSVYLSSEPDPEPAMASKKQDEKRRPSRFVFEYQEAA
jgi:hypothetical protein